MTPSPVLIRLGGASSASLKSNAADAKASALAKRRPIILARRRQQASDFNRGIRGHWHIENTLYWTKDVVFKEDASKIRSGNAPENLSLIKTWVMAVFRRKGHTSMAKAIRLVANDLQLMIQYLE